MTSESTSPAQDSTPPTGCDCFGLTNEAMKEYNTRLVAAWMFNRETGAHRTTVKLATEIIEKKRGARPISMIPTFCPFCGIRYVPEAAR